MSRSHFPSFAHKKVTGGVVSCLTESWVYQTIDVSLIYQPGAPAGEEVRGDRHRLL